MRFDVDFNQAPLLVIWEVTRSCALACRHCRAEAIMGRHPDELSLAQGKQLLDDIKDMGTPLVVFTGGDPLQREDLDDLITYASSIGLRVGGIPATTELLTRDRVQRLKDAGLDQMAISIDAPNAEAHDGFRRVPGAFAKALEGAGWAREVGMPLQVNTVFASWNFEYFEQMAQLVQDLGVVFWEVFFLVPVGRGTVMESCTAQQHEELFAKLQKLSNKVDFVIKVTEAPHYRAYLARQGVGDGHLGAEGKGIGSAHHRSGGAIRRSKTGVNSGKGFCFVDHTGNVNPSGFLPIEAGNVKEQTITSIYRDSPLFRELRNPALLKGV